MILRAIKKQVIADMITPVSAYSKFEAQPFSFLLESVERGRAGRYSFIGIMPYEVFEINKGSIRILGRDNDGKYTEKENRKTDDPLSYIEYRLNGISIKEEEGLPPLSGGLVGYLGYEIIGSWEKINFSNKDTLKAPQGVLFFTDELIVFDHTYNLLTIIKLVSEECGEEDRKNAEKRIDEIEKQLFSLAEPLEPLSCTNGKEMKFSSNFSKEEFEEGVRRIKKDIYSGEIIQAVFSQRLETESEGRVFNYYRALRVINPSPYMFYIKADDFILCGASPEVMVKKSGDQAVVRPIAGTRKRTKTAEEDKKVIEELKKDKKEIAEHVMLVDLGRNDLGRVCLPGTVTVDELMTVELYSHVMHMVSNVYGKMRPGTTCVDLFKACFPAGTVSGAPKIRAIQIIEREENLSRSAYAGAIGYFSFSGDMDMGITIRTIFIKNGRVYAQAGAGIVADSVPENEYYETMNKARAALEAVSMGNV